MGIVVCWPEIKAPTFLVHKSTSLSTLCLVPRGTAYFIRKDRVVMWIRLRTSIWLLGWIKMDFKVISVVYPNRRQGGITQIVPGGSGVLMQCRLVGSLLFLSFQEEYCEPAYA